MLISCAPQYKSFFIWLCRKECCSPQPMRGRSFFELRLLGVAQPVPPFPRQHPRHHIPPVIPSPTLRHFHMTREQPALQDLLNRQPPIQHPALHRRRRGPTLLLPPTNNIVTPHREDRQVLRAALTTLRPSNRLPSVIAATVTDEQVRQVRLP